jgi:FHS family glucose/mannose:H+ symporter-like MFS transporter
VQETDFKQRADHAVLSLLYCLAFLQGFTINLLPVLFRTVGAVFHVGMAGQGQLQSVFCLGALLVGFWGGSLYERLGWINTAIACLFLLSAGALIIALSPFHSTLLVGAVLLGTGNAWLTVVYSAPIADHFPSRRQQIFTWALTLMAMGGMIGPVLLGFVIEKTPNWRWPLLALSFIFLLGCLGLRPLRTSTWNSRCSNGEVNQKSSLKILRSGVLWSTGLLYLMHGLGGGILIAWIGRYYQQLLGIGDERAGLLLSVNAGGFMAGRLVLGAFVSGKLPDRVLLTICAGGATVAFSFLIVERSYSLALVFIALEGFWMSGDSPSISSLTAKQFPGAAGVAFAVVQAISAIGSISAPLLGGLAAEKYGLNRAMWLGPGCIGSLAAFSIVLELYDRNRDRSWAVNPLSGEFQDLKPIKKRHS